MVGSVSVSKAVAVMACGGVAGDACLTSSEWGQTQQVAQRARRRNQRHIAYRTAKQALESKRASTYHPRIVRPALLVSGVRRNVLTTDSMGRSTEDVSTVTAPARKKASIRAVFMAEKSADAWAMSVAYERATIVSRVLETAAER